jgi:hypothetical protein
VIIRRLLRLSTGYSALSALSAVSVIPAESQSTRSREMAPEPLIMMARVMAITKR